MLIDIKTSGPPHLAVEPEWLFNKYFLPPISELAPAIPERADAGCAPAQARIALLPAERLECPKVSNLELRAGTSSTLPKPELLSEVIL
jgi:hypothetical protein